MCYGFSVLAWWFMAWHGVAHTKKLKRKSHTISLSHSRCHHFRWFHRSLFGEHTAFFPSCVPSDIISDRHTYALEPMTLTFYDWISDDISIIPWFWWHVPMCLSQWCARLECQYCLGNSDLFRSSSLPTFSTYINSDLKIWLKYIENYR